MRFSQRKIGWIGVDVGTSTVKIAQVARSRQGWRLAASAVVPRQQGWQTDLTAATEAISSLDEMQAARSLQTGYAGRRVAATLPMALCDVHRLDGSLDQHSNPQQVLRQTIETATQQSVEQIQCDYWSTPSTEDKPGWTQALTVGRSWTDQLCEDIARTGWTCETIDGLPLAMARAVGMVRAETSTAPLAALDWGNGRATLCLIENEQPTYVRCLKGCGLGNLITALVERLQVTEPEAQQLLEDYGLSAPASANSSEIAKLVQEIIAEPMGQIVEEIKRSFSHYQYLLRAKGPQCLYLFGGGAMIKQLDAHLSAQLKIETNIWQLPTQSSGQGPSDHHADCLLAPAIALSALAWGAV